MRAARPSLRGLLLHERGMSLVLVLGSLGMAVELVALADESAERGFTLAMIGFFLYLLFLAIRRFLLVFDLAERGETAAGTLIRHERAVFPPGWTAWYAYAFGGGDYTLKNTAGFFGTGSPRERVEILLDPNDPTAAIVL